MLPILAVLIGVAAGFGGARVLRRPARVAAPASVARSVGGAVGARRDLDLPHLQRSTLSEMMRHVGGPGPRPTVPPTFRVRLHPDDHATVQQAPGFFVQGLEQALAAAGRDHGWDVPRRIRIELTADPARRRGAPAVDAAEPAPPPSAPAPAAVPAPASGTTAAIEGPDGRHELTGDDVGIGRGSDQPVRIDDSRVSRRHATLVRAGTGWALRDEGSSNGTRVAGRAVPPHQPVPLADGTEIAVGPVTLVFRAGRPAAPAPAAPPAGDATRAWGRDEGRSPVLGDDERRAISAEYLPDDLGRGGSR